MSLFAMKIELFLKNNTVFDRVKRKMKGKRREKLFLEKPERNSLGTMPCLPPPSRSS